MVARTSSRSGAGRCRLVARNSQRDRLDLDLAVARLHETADQRPVFDLRRGAAVGALAVVTRVVQERVGHADRVLVPAIGQV